MRYIWLASLGFAGLMLVSLGCAVCVAHASETETSITYRFSGEYRGAWRDARDAWNQVARRRGLPQLVRARPGDASRVDLVIESRCRSGSLTGRYREAAGILFINRCGGLSWVERRKVYSHELGHVYDLRHRPGGVMPAFIEHQRAVYPTVSDARRAETSYDGL